METKDITCIGRSLDRRNRYNQMIISIVLLSLFGGMAGGWLIKESFQHTIITGLLLAALVFFCWAISREIDPDHPQAAFIGIPLVVGLFFFTSESMYIPLFLLSVWILFSTRIVNRSPGYVSGFADMGMLILFSLFLSLIIHPLYLALVSIVFAFDSLLKPSKKRSIVFMCVSIVFFAITSILFNPPWFFTEVSMLLLLILLLILGVTLLLVVSTQKIKSVGDLNNKPLQPSRIQAAVIIVFLTLMFSILLLGIDGIYLLLSAFGSLLGVSVFRIAHLVFTRATDTS